MVAYSYQEPLSCSLLRQSQLMTGWEESLRRGMDSGREENRLNIPETILVLRETNRKRHTLGLY